MDRRSFLQTLITGAAATSVASMPASWAFARTPGRQRFVFILLRGGLDGLGAVVPYGDPQYRQQRSSLAFAAGELQRIDSTFALAPGLAALMPLLDAGELSIVPATAIPMRTRSHFDAQAILETGLPSIRGSADGWMNRLLGTLDGENIAVAVAAGLPRSLTGPQPVLTWSPSRLGAVDDDYIERLHYLYQQDARLQDRFEAALQLRDIEGDDAAGIKKRGQMTPVLIAAADLLKRQDGPNIAALEFNGWDTHRGQGMAQGSLDRRLKQLADGLAAFRKAMGSHWSTMNVVVLSEFGRTVRPNGSGGTDHGTGGVGFVLGADLARVAVHGDWPGLREADLFENRDVRPIHDTRALLQAVLRRRFDLNSTQLTQVFPEANSLRPLSGLMT